MHNFLYPYCHFFLNTHIEANLLESQRFSEAGDIPINGLDLRDDDSLGHDDAIRLRMLEDQSSSQAHSHSHLHAQSSRDRDPDRLQRGGGFPREGSQDDPQRVPNFDFRGESIGSRTGSRAGSQPGSRGNSRGGANRPLALASDSTSPTGPLSEFTPHVLVGEGENMEDSMEDHEFDR